MKKTNRKKLYSNLIFLEEKERLNENFQDEIQKVYTERLERFKNAKQFLESNSEHSEDSNSKKCSSIKGIDIRSRIRA